jgi:tetratricopeptide (TPR) repeat protein
MKVSTERGRAEGAPELVQEAETLISAVLHPGRWPQRQTVQKFMEDDRLQKVLSLYTAAMELDPNEPSYPWNLASTLRRLGLNDLALAFIERALRVGMKVEPEEWDTPGTYLAWADAAIEAGQYDVALIPIAHAMKMKEDHPDVVPSAKQLLRVIKRNKQSKNPAKDLADELGRVPA